MVWKADFDVPLTSFHILILPRTCAPAIKILDLSKPHGFCIFKMTK